MVSQEDIERLRELLARPAQNIVIVSHTNPDGDAVGSSLAWREALLEMGHSEGSRAFARYRHIDDEIKKELVNLLD